MPKLNSSPRTRVINFRLTEHEFEVIQSACRVEGGQNFSEFARRATLDLARSRTNGNAGVQTQLDKLGERLSRVDSVLGELVTTLKPVRSAR
jgi:hypothetical protein